MNSLKIVGAAILLLVLSYFFNPLNGIMRESMVGPFSFMVRIGPELVSAIAQLVLLALLVGAPCLLLKSTFSNHPVLKTGLFSAAILTLASLFNFVIFEKDSLAISYWYIVAPSFAAVYFLLGLASGGFWAFVGNRSLRS